MGRKIGKQPPNPRPPQEKKSKLSLEATEETGESKVGERVWMGRGHVQGPGDRPVQ